VLGIVNDAVTQSTAVIFFSFAILWGINGWMQSMGSPPGVICLSRWFPKSKRGIYYSIFSSTPYIGEFLSFVITGLVVGALGWKAGFVVAAVAGLIGSLIILWLVSDTPESKGLPSVQQLSGEDVTKHDVLPTRDLQKYVLKHPGIWVIALSSAFIYITKYAITGWGVLFLQKEKGFSIEDATQIIGFYAVAGIVGTVMAGWLSDRLFKSDRVKPAILAGLLSFITLALFLFTDTGYMMNVIYVSVFSLAIGVLYCIVAGLMAIDIVPRKATGAALGVVGISSYIAAGLQDITSGYLIEFNTTQVDGVDIYNFGPVSWFWLAAALISFLLPVINWKKMKGRS
jgi:OPA family sugar phosphate sensor protein UhpC-like MFS transporter